MSFMITCLYGEQNDLCGSLCSLLEYFLEKDFSQITYANNITMTTNRQIWSWPDYHKTKENVKIKLLDMCLFTFYSVHAIESTWHWL